MSEEKIPTSFNDFKVAELRKIADEDFAVDAEGNKQEVLAALAESGVTFDMYVELHPEIFSKEDEVKVVEETADPGVVTASQMQEPVEEPKVIVAEPVKVPLNSNDQWLIKMVRANPLYEVRGYRFTQENPYKLVPAADAEYLLTREEGFRQATPGELQEFYG